MGEGAGNLPLEALADQGRDLLKRELVTTMIGQHITEAPGQVLRLVGMIQRVRRITTKKGAMMAFLNLKLPAAPSNVSSFPRRTKASRMF